jgi:tetratricopeptide (TPR) repeat protein
MAYSFDAKDDFKEKMDESEKMWKKDMSAAQLLKEEGNQFFKVGKIPEALQKYEAGIKALKPDETALKAQLYNNVAHCNVQLYDPKKVIAACDEVHRPRAVQHQGAAPTRHRLRVHREDSRRPQRL